MGNFLASKPNRSLQEAYNPSMEGWSMVERTTEYNIWRNPITQQEIQQYRFMVNDEDEFKRQKIVFESRHGNNNLVATRFFVDDSEKQFCSSYFKGNLYTQRIPLKLVELEKIGFPEILHVYAQCFRGFAELFDAVGFFSLHEELIGVNTDGVVKVWLNRDFGKSHAEPVYVQGTQRQMMIRLVKMISSFTQERLPVNLADLILRNNTSSFRDAFITLESLATRFNIDIPDYLPSVFGRMRRMMQNHSRISSEMNSNSQIIPRTSQYSESKPNMHRKSMATDSVLSFKEIDQRFDNKVNFKKMPIDYSSRNSLLKKSNHSMASAFPDLSRISRISVPKQRKVQFVAMNTFSPPHTRSHPIISPIKSVTNKQSTAKLFASPQTKTPPRTQKNTELYFSSANYRVPAENIKHLPIIRESLQHENSHESSKQSFNYHLSDHNRLAEKYLNKFRNNEDNSIHTTLNPQMFDQNRTLTKFSNHIVPQSKQMVIQKSEIDIESNVSKFSIIKKSSEYQESEASAKYPNKSSHPFLQYARISQYSSGRTPIVSSSRTGVVYKQTDAREPTIISDQSVINQSFNGLDQNPTNKKISMARFNNPPMKTLGVIEESYYSKEMDPELLSDLNTFRKKRIVPTPS